ncbi:hypothetical protein JH06_4854 [Blastocystis sp. subtype 4]|uniref:hypothetical protein n=1 Tax=Blastocystis sp. subtype 4 TaxID=944170 RepID=UPI000711F0E4|nr:hypothetical protein JH06_4854 [Blastocystis sp. subtype 4]KNB41682.1 hypothetical protein JH06_4854 [Blastocystis sp. subtype 4]|eukprot:XP_014525125.1 hypothetical protein JH06_4854 [Blastocystis sp. subtype 4]
MLRQYSSHYREEKINSYSITVAEAGSACLLAWRLEGSNVGRNWVTLDVRDNPGYFQDRKTERFFLPYQQTSYPLYRISFLRSVNGLPFTLSEISLETRDLVVSSPELRYPTAKGFFFPGQQNVLIEPIYPGYSDFQLQGGILPEGLAFSTTSGSITGSIPETASFGSAVFTVTARHALTGSITYSTSFSLFVMECGGSNTHLQLSFTCSGPSGSDSWQIWNSDLLIAEQFCSDVSDGTQVFTTDLCLQSTAYRLRLSTETLNGWSSGTKLRLAVITTTTPAQSMRLGDVTLPKGYQSEDIPLSLQMLSEGYLSDWFYRSTSDVPVDWYKASFTEGWSSLPIGDVTLSRSVWLFRRSINLVITTDITILDMEVFAEGGLVVYVNDVELYRCNVPSGDIQEQWTTSKTSSAYWHVIQLALSSSTLHVGSNVVSIAVINHDASSRVVDFRCIALFSSHHTHLSRITNDDAYHTTHSITDSSHLTGHPGSLLFDASASTTYQASASLPSYSVDVSLLSDRRDVFNQYCVTSSFSHPSHDPQEWYLRASTDGSSWMELHHVSAAVFTRGERKCFVLNPSFLSFYQLYITSVQGDVSLEVSEWSLLYKSVAQTSVEQFVLQKEEIVLFLGIPVSEVFLSNTEKFQDFYMSPVLPGVRIDAKNGRLFGTPEEVRDSTMVTIGGVSEGGVTREVTVRMSVRRCEDDREYTLVHVNVTGLSGTDRCEVILQGEAGVVLHESVEKQPEQELHSALCVPSGSYSLMFVPMLAGTVSYSYRISQNEPRSGLFDASSTFTTFTFTTQSLIPAASALWRYWIIDSPPPTDWYQSGTSESWRKSTASLIPEMEGTTGYYCTTFSASYSSQVSAFSVGAYVQGGIVMYLNGVEINRVYLPEGSLDYHTLPLKESTTPETIVFSGSIQFLPFSVDSSIQVANGPEGHNNRFCIEEHRIPSATPTTFSLYMEYIQDGSNRILEGEPWGSVSGVASPWYEYIENAFDGNPTTKFFGASDCMNVLARWTYNHERKEYVNYLRLYAGNSPSRRPQSIRLEASNDQENWNVLIEASNLEWPSQSQYGYWKEWELNNTHSYNAYQLVGNGCISEGIEYAEIILQSRRSNVACEAMEGFPGAAEGAVSYGPCPPYHSGFASRLCQNGHFSETDTSTCIPFAPSSLSYNPSRLTVYTQTFIQMVPSFSFYVDFFNIYPGLPVGITMNSTSGMIYGTPVFESPNTVYTIVAQNERGRTSTTVELYVRSGCADITDFAATPVGQTETYYCSRVNGMYGKVKRTCTEVDGLPVWGAPVGYCKSVASALILAVLLLIIVSIVLAAWCISETVSRRMNVYQLPNGEYELEEVEDTEGEEMEGEMEEVEEGKESTVRQRRTRVRARPQMKLIGRPVFIYIPRYFHKKKDYNYQYHRINRPPRNRVYLCFLTNS